jgi:hypothetical protein
MDTGRIKVLKQLLRKNERLQAIVSHELNGVRFFSIPVFEQQDQQLDDERSFDDLDLMAGYDDSDDEGNNSIKSNQLCL